MELTDAGFDHPVLSHFRDRLIESGRQELLLDRILNLLREKQLLNERGKQRTDRGARFGGDPCDEPA